MIVQAILFIPAAAIPIFVLLHLELLLLRLLPIIIIEYYCSDYHSFLPFALSQKITLSLK